MNNQSDILIIGAGFYGCYLAEYFANKGLSVTLIDKESELMTRASFANQARVHNGYHYPRSVLTALKSRISFPRFVSEFEECIDKEFEKYYLIGKPLSKVTGRQFTAFCDRIGAPYYPAETSITKLFNKAYVEASFKTIEYAFDSIKLRRVMKDRLEAANVRVITSTEVILVSKNDLGLSSKCLDLTSNTINTFHSSKVFNCTYSMLNHVVSNSKIPQIPLKHEMTEMCLIDVPDEIRKLGITVMCGPFFSTMPFPSMNVHSLSHVRYTPHYEWSDSNELEYFNGHQHHSKAVKKSKFKSMIQDAKRYIPILEESKYIKSIWEVKTVLPRSEVDDSRPILYKEDYGFRGFNCVMGGKIDNIYDVVESIELGKIS